ncbi:MAG TPA: heparan-alpha-glucosaminide N-acetyltransferase domain-containing protein, partial [Saprospiraceae bacterium]|nr:heparan-alpha-glucosaminide N-acetyltransferase domain-containing protein [Saprospiraceae bacterium]
MDHISSTAVTSPKIRLHFLDALRAFAILMMLQGHFVDTLLAPEYRDLNSPIFNAWTFMRGLTAPVFFTVTGIVFVFLLLKENKPLKEHVRVRKGIRRAFFLLALGYLLKWNVY